MSLNQLIFGLCATLLVVPPCPAGDRLPEGAVASLDGQPLAQSQFHAYVGREFRFEARAVELLQLMIQQRVILGEAERQSLSVDDKELELRLEALDRETSLQTEGAKNLQAVLAEQGITREEFLPSLRVSLLAEKLVRQEFDIPDRQAVPYEKTHLWIEDRLQHAVIQTAGLPPEILVQVNGRPLDEVEFGQRYLLDQKGRQVKWLEDFIDSEVIRQAARRQGLELGSKDVEAGIRQRERKVLEDPRYGGATLDELLQKTRRSLSWLKSSREFQTQVLLERMVREEYPNDGLEGYYRDHLEEFDKLYGPSVHIRAILLKAGHEGAFAQGFVPRLYDDAEAELLALRDRIVAGQATLVELAQQRSEHPSRQAGGDLGFVSASHPKLSELARAGLEAQRLNEPLGPVRTAEGVYLFEVLKLREKPQYAQLIDKVLAQAAADLFEKLKSQMHIVRRNASADR